MKKFYMMVLCCFVLAFSTGVHGFEMRSQQVYADGFSIQLQLPESLQLEFVAALQAPRFITTGPDGELLIGSRGQRIYRFPYPYGGGETLVAGLGSYIHSTAYRQGRLYAADTAALYSAPYLGAATQLDAGDFQQVTPIPSATGGHSSRTIVRGPDNRLYLGLGLSGNCSEDEYLSNNNTFEKRRGGVFVLGADNSLEPFASGLRNPIGLAFHPQTDQLYATNAGPDNLGYYQPPEILARLSAGSFHGMPWFQYYNGAFRSGQCTGTPPPLPASRAVVPSAMFDPRSTPEGIVFLHDSILGDRHGGSALVAIHGSWATKPGQGRESRRPPKVVLVEFEGGSPKAVNDVVTGFQRADGSRFARPCGVAIGADGNIYFTSDGGEVEGLFRLVPTSSTRRSIPSVYGLLLDKP